MTLVEAAVETLDAALAAERAGADRIELCANLNEGGTTPSPALIAAVVAQTRLPVFVLIRSRGGDFVYTNHEIDTMTRDIELSGSRGIAGIVTGALTSDRRVNLEHTRILTTAAAGLPVTFHRAFDCTANLLEALERVIDLGANRVLTSGARADLGHGGWRYPPPQRARCSWKNESPRSSREARRRSRNTGPQRSCAAEPRCRERLTEETRFEGAENSRVDHHWVPEQRLVDERFFDFSVNEASRKVQFRSTLVPYR